MPPIKRLLLVYHTRTGLSHQIASSMRTGAINAASTMGSPLSVDFLRPREATVGHLLRADGYLFACPENLASVSGEMLEFFHDKYYYAFSADGEGSLIAGRPVGMAVASGSDGSAAAAQMSRICRGWRLREVTEEVLVVKNGLVQTKENILSKKAPMGEKERQLCEEIGGLVAATVLLEGE